MATGTRDSQTDDIGILARLLGPEVAGLSVEAAQALLTIRFEQSDLDRIHELAVKNQENALTSSDQAELESYLRVSAFLDLVHAMARRALKKRV